MHLADFQCLSKREQLDLLYNEGIYVGKRKHNAITFVMLQVEDFYVEIEYRQYRLYIKTIKCFHSTVYLDPYLEQISLN